MPLYAAVAAAPWVASDNGLLAAICDPAAGSSTSIMIGGTVYLGKIPIRQALTVTNVLVNVTTGGNNTGGSTGTFVGLYSSTGTLLSGSSDVAASLTTNGSAPALALTTPQALAGGSFVWAAIVANLGTTQPTLRVHSANSTATANVGLTAAVFRSTANGTLQAALPSPSITPSGNTGGLPFWFGLS